MKKNQTAEEKKYFKTVEDKENDTVTINYYRFTNGNMAAELIKYYIPSDKIEGSSLSNEQKKDLQKTVNDLMCWIVVFIGITEQAAIGKNPYAKTFDELCATMTKISDKNFILRDKIKEYYKSHGEELAFGVSLDDL